MNFKFIFSLTMFVSLSYGMEPANDTVKISCDIPGECKAVDPSSNQVGRASFNPDTCYIKKLRVDPSFQNKGIGTKLLHETLKVLEKDGCDTVSWTVKAKQCSRFDDLKKFYTKIGAAVTDSEWACIAYARYNFKSKK